VLRVSDTREAMCCGCMLLTNNNNYWIHALWVHAIGQMPVLLVLIAGDLCIMGSYY
jgi:hypothetical protein